MTGTMPYIVHIQTQADELFLHGNQAASKTIFVKKYTYINYLRNSYKERKKIIQHLVLLPSKQTPDHTHDN